MGFKKLVRFEELKSFTNVKEFPSGTAGEWSGYFKNKNSITLELACGKGEYAVGLARTYPEKNFIGVDIKGNRIWVGAKKALQDKLVNVLFLRTEIDRIDEYFAKDEVDDIWITFPDPQLRMSKARKRLTHPKFLRLYQKFLKPGGRVHLKTDSPVLYDFTKTVIELFDCIVHDDINDVYKMNPVPKDLQIKTHYEGLDIAGSERIHYLSFSLPLVLPGIDKDALLKQQLVDAKLD